MSETGLKRMPQPQRRSQESHAPRVTPSPIEPSPHEATVLHFPGGQVMSQKEIATQETERSTPLSWSRAVLNSYNGGPFKTVLGGLQQALSDIHFAREEAEPASGK